MNITTMDSEIDDFYVAIQSLEYDPTDFEVRPIKWLRTAKPVSAVHDLIIVKRRCNSIEIAYPAVSRTAGLLIFLDDLMTGAFGVRDKQNARYLSGVGRTGSAVALARSANKTKTFD